MGDLSITLNLCTVSTLTFDTTTLTDIETIAITTEELGTIATEQTLSHVTNVVIGLVFGGIVGVLLVTTILILLLALVWQRRRYKRVTLDNEVLRQEQLSREERTITTDADYDQVIETEKNDAYIVTPVFVTIQTKDNVAYAGIDYVTDQVEYDYV